MMPEEIRKKIRQIEIHTRRMLSGSHVGDYSTAIKGSGFEFDQIREYQQGDDVRFIDWKGSARSNKLLVRQYLEERNRSIMLLVDVSGSTAYGTGSGTKYERIAELASVLALVAGYGKDNVGLILFADDIVRCIPPRSGRAHVTRVMNELFSQRPVQQGTNITAALKQLMALKRSGTITFLISDFVDDGFLSTLKVAARAHDLIAVRCLDHGEYTMPDMGFVEVDDLETGERVMLDARSYRTSAVNRSLDRRAEDQAAFFKQCHVDYFDVVTDRSYLNDLVLFFRRRLRY